MLFTSGLFLFFVAVILTLYYTVPKKGQWMVLLAASYLFYFSAGAELVVFLLYTTAVTFFTALWMQKRVAAEELFVAQNRDNMEKAERKAYRAAQKKKRFHILVGGLVLGFGLLAVLKYTAFVMDGVNKIVGTFGGKTLSIPSLLLPLGISFYTFQSMGYLIDVYRGRAQAETNFFRFALFVSYFPQLVQGPISRASQLAPQLTAEHPFDGFTFRSGLCRVVYGYFKKLVVADTAMIAVKTLAEKPEAFKGVYVLLLILLYSVQIYGDFTGGIDITIGLSEMMGIRLVENFDRPFSSKSVKEYWRRWHITMGTWFTDYIFYPISVCIPMQRFSKWSRKTLGNAVGKRLPVYFATLATWFLTGLWHGAGWNFIVWGMLNCLVMMVSQEMQPLWNAFAKRFPNLVASSFWGAWQAVRTFLIVGLIRSLDVYGNVPLTFRLWGSMLTHWNWGELFTGGLTSFGLTFYDYAVILGGVAVISVVSRLGKKEPLRHRLAARPVLMTALLCALVILILIFGAYGIGYDASQFIYNQF